MTSSAAHSIVTGAPKLPASVLHQLNSVGPLLSWWIPALLATISVAVVFLVIWRGRGRKLRALLAAPIAAVLLVLTAASAVNVYAGYVPTVSAVAPTLSAWTSSTSTLPAGPGAGGRLASSAMVVTQPSISGGGAVWSTTLGSAALAVPSSPLWVYTPPGYTTSGSSARYPVVYVLHGHPGHANDWFTAGDLQRTADVLIAAHVIPPTIFVSPDTNGGPMRDTEGLNVVNGPQIQTYLSHTVVSWADHNLRTLPDRNHRIIAGMSSGGFAALNLGLRHQNIFGGVIALEPYGTPGTSALHNVLAGNQQAYRAQSPASYLPTMHLRKSLKVYLDVGSHNNTAAVRHLADQVRAAGATVTFNVQRNQGHTWNEARKGIAFGLASNFAATHTGQQQVGAV